MTKQCPRMTEDEIKAMAMEFVKGRLFCATHIPPEQQAAMVPAVFMPLMLGGLDDIDVETIGNIVENMDAAGPRCVNGYPMFLSMRLVHKDDWDAVYELAVKAQGALDAALKGSENA